MVTMVGIQIDFGNALIELVELELDAIEAYKLAISKLENQNYKTYLEEFVKDHENHVEKLNELLIAHGKRSVKEAGLKQWLAKGKVYLRDLIGDDNSILKAMLSNEEDTNTAYERMNSRDDRWEDAREILAKSFENEKKHKKWIEYTLMIND
jgi:predicted outer membrane protein